MWTKRLSGFNYLVCALVFAGAAQISLADEPAVERFRVGPLYQEGPGSIAVVAELPYGMAQPEASSFRLRLDGQDLGSASEIQSFLASGKDMAWLICLDISGTMTGPPLQDAKSALHSLLSDSRTLRPGLLTFGTKILKRVGFLDGRDKLTRAIDNLQGEGARSKTRLYQGLYEALDYYESAAKAQDLPLRKRILVISDGKDEGSSASAESVIRRSLALGIPIDAVGHSRIQNQYIESLHHLADATGGRFVHARPEVVGLSDALSRIYGELMETQTVMVHFRYPVRSSGETTSDIAVNLQRSGNAPPLSGRLDATVGAAQTAPVTSPPSPTPVQQPEQEGPDREWLPWAIGGGSLLAVLLLLWLAFRSSRSPSDAQGTGEGSTGDFQATVFPEGFSEPALPPLANLNAFNGAASSPREERKTVVGGYFPPPGPGRPTAYLTGMSGAITGQQFPLELSECRIGADSLNDLVIPGDTFVSKKHAVLRYERGSLYIADLQSRNGTFVNDRQVTEAARVLMPGDHIRVGKSIFQLRQG